MKNRPGQSVLEYTILLTIAAMALLGMFSYMRNAFYSNVHRLHDMVAPEAAEEVEDPPEPPIFPLN